MSREVSTSFSEGRPSRLKKTAGDLAGCKGLFLIVHGEREEIDSLSRFSRRHGGDEHHRVPIANQGGAVRLLGETAHFNGELPTVEVPFDDPHEHNSCTRSRHAARCERVL
jgi:hypothetical protein